MLVQPLVHGITDAARSFGHLHGVVTHQQVDLVKTGHVFRQDIFRCLRRQPLIHQTGGMVGDAIFALVQFGYDDQDDLQIALG